MAERWRIEEQSDGRVEVQRNGRWYTEDDSVDDALILLRSHRARTVEVVWKDGYEEVRRL